MKKTLLCIAALAIAHPSFAQWTPSGNNVYYSSGNVGIGTAPSGRFSIKQSNDGYLGGISLIRSGTSDTWSIVNGGDNSLYLGYASNASGAGSAGDFSDKLVFTGAGNVGIGSTSPQNKLYVNGGITSIGGGPASIAGTPAISVFFDAANDRGAIYSLNNLVSWKDMLLEAQTFTWVSGLYGHTGLYQDASANVGIGTTTPDAKLAVNGTIHTKEVKVDLTGWPDYIFKPKYNLSSLTEVKNYIDKNHRLPDMPSEQEVTKNGINLGEMNKLLVKKVEELILYAIDQQKQIEQLKQEQQKGKQQDARIATLEIALAKLTASK